jgi:hypothetical protein
MPRCCRVLKNTGCKSRTFKNTGGSYNFFVHYMQHKNISISYIFFELWPAYFCNRAS